MVAGPTRRRSVAAGRPGGARQRQGVVVGIGYRGPNPEGNVDLAVRGPVREVEVDTRTGEVRLLRFLGAHDTGRVMNRLTYDNQVFGGITMGIGLGLTEERVLDRQTGKMVNPNWHDYKIPTMMDVPLEHDVRADRPARPRVQHDRRQGARRAGDDPDRRGDRQRGRPRRPGSG